MDNEAPQGEGAPAPVETVEKVEPTAAPDGGQVEAEAKPAQLEQPVEDKEPRGVAKRLKELTDRIRAAEAREERYLKLLEGKQAPEQRAEPETEKGLADFGYDEKQYRAYLTEQTTKAAREAAKAEAVKLRQEQEIETRRSRFNERAAKFAETTADFHDVFNSDVPVSEAMGEALMDSDEGPAVAYYLGQNPDIAAKLAQLSPVMAGREIARIEDRIVAERKKAAERAVTQAPAPTPKIDAADPGNVENDPSKMTDAQFRKWREKQIAQRR